MKSELKPCMKCGSDAVKLDYRWDSITLSKSYFVYCVNCNTYFYGNYAEDSTITKWNTRPAEDALKAEVERLKEALSDMCALWNALGAKVPPVLNEQKYLNAKALLTKDAPEKG